MCYLKRQFVTWVNCGHMSILRAIVAFLNVMEVLNSPVHPVSLFPNLTTKIDCSLSSDTTLNLQLAGSRPNDCPDMALCRFVFCNSRLGCEKVL